MQQIDLNLLPAVLALLEEENVTRAARRLHLSVPAASRALARSRRAFGDPLLVRQGRGVVRTPQGQELLARLGPVMEQVSALFERPGPFDPSMLQREFVIRANEAVIAALGSRFVETVRSDAPRVELRFELEAANDIDTVRSGDAALAIGSYSDVTGELDTETIAEESLVGILRAGHPAGARRMTLRAFAALDHIVVSRHGRARGPVDSYLAQRGLERTITAVVPSFSAALAMAAQSDLTTVAPSRLAAVLGGPGGLVRYVPPIPLPAVQIQQVWHARYTADPEHTWLRGCVCRAAAALEAASA